MLLNTALLFAVALCTWFQAIMCMHNVTTAHMLLTVYSRITPIIFHSGRAGNKGTAITFISPEEDQYAGDLVKALKESKAPIPEDLLTMAKEHAEKVKRGEARAHGSGYGGSGFKFDSAEEDKEKDRRKVNCCADLRWCNIAASAANTVLAALPFPSLANMLLT